ncbi:MAG: hypothetical protein M1819_005862 [Sarea resinae]|nr:MAG: hypothetical protein M1819_005862 [Sarea resinae]
MNEDLENEFEAINSIYGDSTLQKTGENHIYALHIPDHSIVVRLEFPPDYPDAPPAVLGTQTSGDGTKKGDATHVVHLVREVLGRVYRPGEVCLFDLLEEVTSILAAQDKEDASLQENNGDRYGQSHEIDRLLEDDDASTPETSVDEEPPWILSEVMSEKKSVFIAHCAPVESPTQAKQYLNHLLANDKKVAKASHNMTAWRIKGENEVIFQDCDDDGETAAGGRLLHLMQLMDIWGVMVVVSRWYGGTHLGPDRFRIINSVARDAFVRGGYVKEHGTASGGKKKGKK